MTLPLQPNLSGLPLAPAQCIVDPALKQQVKLVVDNSFHYLDSDTIVADFLSTYVQWIKHSELNTLHGIDCFNQVDYSQGTTESFDHFYIKHSQRRFRCFQGEYLYHQLVWNRSCPNWKFLESEPLAPGDALIVSVPFADTGNLHPALDKKLLDLCWQLQVPVLVDMAFFGICANINFDLSHPAITDVCFSLSKTFPVNLLRIGMRLTKDFDDDGLAIYNRTQYVNRAGAGIGLELLDILTADATFLKYRDKQTQWCQQHGLQVSDTVIFGLDLNHRYDQYNRGSPDSNRICFAKCYQFDSWPEDIKID
jgi:hypothetical protein